MTVDNVETSDGCEMVIIFSCHFYATPIYQWLSYPIHWRFQPLTIFSSLSIIQSAAIASGNTSSGMGGINETEANLGQRSPFKSSSPPDQLSSNHYQTSPLQKHNLSNHHPLHANIYKSSPLHSTSEMDDDDEADVIRWGKWNHL